MRYAFLILFVLALSPALHAEIHKWRDENGTLHFSDKPPVDIESEVIVVEPNVYAQPTIEEVSVDLASNGKVVMYSTTWCGYCRKAREYFRTNKIAFKEYDVETNAKGKRDYKRLNASGVPVILVGKKRLNGFSEKKFDAIYKK